MLVDFMIYQLIFNKKSHIFEHSPPGLPSWILYGGISIAMAMLQHQLRYFRITFPETNTSPLKMGHTKRKFIFQPLIFTGHVSFRECIWDWTIHPEHILVKYLTIDQPQLLRSYWRSGLSQKSAVENSRPIRSMHIPIGSMYGILKCIVP